MIVMEMSGIFYIFWASQGGLLCATCISNRNVINLNSIAALIFKTVLQQFFFPDDQNPVL